MTPQEALKTYTPQEALKTYFGYDTFRPLQEDIINSVLAGNDTLALMPTGGGKSLCFQIPELVMAEQSGGLCLVVTPLIALMKDQVENLRRRNIPAEAVYTGMSKTKVEQALDNCTYGPYRFLYVSPERLESRHFRSRIARLPINLIAVDEAHCISQWGYDFRPSYLRIADIRELLSPSPYKNRQVPVLALTATATPDVAEDIQLRLTPPAIAQEGEKGRWNVFRQSFGRKNLCYIVRRCADSRGKTDQLLHILQHVQGSAIVYVRNRKHTEDLTQLLCSEGIEAQFYHAGLTTEERTRRQEAWKNYGRTENGGTRVMVCTNAFGMGIDKPDVRIVLHYDTPDSPEAYFQEAGRAGRDGDMAYAVLLYAPDDKGKMSKRIADNYPPKEFVEKVYHNTSDYLCVGAGSGEGHTFSLHINDLCRVMRLPVMQTYSALHLLTQAGYIDFQEEQETQARVKLNVARTDLPSFQLSDKQRSVLQALMRNYTGVFTDLQYLHEEIDEETHEALAGLAARHILTYIPRTRACALTYTRERQTGVFLPEAVYEKRAQRYTERLNAMLEYAEQGRFCRQQILQHYFGEEDAEACGTCDVCRAAHQRKTDVKE